MSGQLYTPDAVLLQQAPYMPIQKKGEWAPESVWMLLKKRTSLAPARN